MKPLFSEPQTITQENYSPSVFAQADDIIKADGLVLGADKQPVTPAIEPIDLDLETLEICIGIPFDFAGLVTKINALELSDLEKRKLAKVWLKPLTRLLSKYPNSDVILAASTTLGIGLEKYLVYLAESADIRNRTRDERQRENELSKG